VRTLWAGLALLLGGCSGLIPDSYEYGTIEVVAARRNGEPVEGVALTLYTGTRHLGYGVTDEQGRFEFRYVPEGRLGVHADPPPSHRPVDLDAGYLIEDNFGEGDHWELSFTYLEFGEGAIEVAVEEPDGSVIPGVRLQLFGPQGVLAEGVTDENGQYSFLDLQLGEYGVFAFPRPAFSLPDGGPMGIAEGLLVDESHVEQVRFTMDACRGAIRVHARDTLGSPVVGLGLEVFRPEGVVTEARTGADGAVTFERLLCGSYGVFIDRANGLTPAGAAGSEWFVDGLSVTEEDVTIVELSYVRCVGEVRARAVDTDGLAVIGAEFILYDSSGGVWKGFSGADGGFVFLNVPCHDNYGIIVVPPVAYTVGEGRGVEFFDGLNVPEGTGPSVTFTLTD